MESESGIRTRRSCSLCQSIQLCLDNRNISEDIIISEDQGEILGNVPVHFLPVILAMSEEDRTCPICQDIIYNGAYLTSCFHLFHTGCLRAFVETGNNTCPICRIKIYDIK